MAASFASEFHLDNMPGHLIVQTSRIRFTQPTDVKGRPAAGVRAGLLQLTLLGEDRAVLSHWAVDPLKASNGYILFKDINGGTLSRLEFEDAYCVRYFETFNVGGSVSAYRFDVGITARILKIDNLAHDNLWSNYLRNG